MGEPVRFAYSADPGRLGDKETLINAVSVLARHGQAFLRA